MSDEPAPPSGHTYLDFNAPMSDQRAAALIAGLGSLAEARILDLGCGWAELLLRVLEAEPTATGVGVDADQEAIERGRGNARRRSLDERVELVVGDVTTWAGAGGDVVIAIGASHAWGGVERQLEAVKAHLRPGGQLLLGVEVWERPPTAAALAALGAEPTDFGDLGAVTDLAIGRGYRPLALSMASTDEWDAFESAWCAGRERWLLSHPDAVDADEVRAVVDQHRDGWLHGYRGVLGFAFLTLAHTDR